MHEEQILYIYNLYIFGITNINLWQLNDDTLYTICHVNGINHKHYKYDEKDDPMLKIFGCLYDTMYVV